MNAIKCSVALASCLAVSTADGSTVVEPVEAIAAKHSPTELELERLRYSALSMASVLRRSNLDLSPGPAMRQIATSKYGPIEPGDHFWEVPYFSNTTMKLSMITFVSEKDHGVYVLCATNAECRSMGAAGP